MNSEFLLLNEKFYLFDEPVLGYKNRAFCYGDAIFDTIHCLGTQAQFSELHWARLIKGMKTLKMQLPNNLHLKIMAGMLLKRLKNRICQLVIK